jgi:Calcineurin-like phosphoesterase
MSFLSRFWHKLVGQKSSVIRVLDEVANRLESKHPDTVAHLNNAFHPTNEEELNALRVKVASALRNASKTVHDEHYSKDDAFESHDQHASLAQSTLNEQLSTLEVTHTGVGDDIDAFFNKYGACDLGGWIPVFLKIVAEKVHLQKKSEFPYVDPNDPSALASTLPDHCKIILVADWGANNDHAANIRDLIKKEVAETSEPVYLIHLGDIYYSGMRSECLTFLRNWPLRNENGPLKGRSFSLNGNHEMYSGGDGYFNIVLPQLGQKASYFVLRSPKWDFYGLDTAYVPACFHSPADSRLDAQWLWLKKQMDGAADRKHVFFTHYQPCSANLPEHQEGRVLREQIAELQTGGIRPVEGWFFGHQHKCYIYEDTRLPYRARLIGNGAFPHDIQREKFPDNDEAGKPLMAFAQLNYRGYPGGLAYSGYVSIDVTNDLLSVRYIDEDGGLFHQEGWLSNSVKTVFRS